MEDRLEIVQGLAKKRYDTWDTWSIMGIKQVNTKTK